MCHDAGVAAPQFCTGIRYESMRSDADNARPLPGIRTQLAVLEKEVNATPRPPHAARTRGEGARSAESLGKFSEQYVKPLEVCPPAHLIIGG